MKKSLLFAAALSFAAAANADVLQLNAEDFGFGSDAVDCAEGTVWGETSYGVFSNPFATQHKAVNCKNNNYNVVVFNGTDEIVTAGGVQGQDNPKDADGTNPGISLSEPIQGAVVKFTAAKDGYVYVVAKLSSNKNYYVFEEGSPVGFTLAMEVESDKLPQLLTYTAEGVGEYNNIEDAGWCDWPENVYYNKILGQEKPEDIKVNGLGVIGFYCYEGCEYLVGAGGSKISWCGAWCGDAPASSVVIKGTDAENPVADFALVGEGGVTPEPEEEVIVLAEGEFVCDGWGNQPNLLSDGGVELQEVGAAAGDVVRFYITPMEQFYYIEIVDGHWGGTFANYSNDENACAEQGRTYNDLSTGYVTLELTQAILDQVCTAGGWGGTFIGNGDNTIITKIELVKNGGAGINNVEAENVTVLYNLNGQKVNEVKGLMIRNGKVILVK